MPAADQGFRLTGARERGLRLFSRESVGSFSLTHRARRAYAELDSIAGRAEGILTVILRAKGTMWFTSVSCSPGAGLASRK